MATRMYVEFKTQEAEAKFLEVSVNDLKEAEKLEEVTRSIENQKGNTIKSKKFQEWLEKQSADHKEWYKQDIGQAWFSYTSQVYPNLKKVNDWNTFGLGKFYNPVDEQSCSGSVDTREDIYKFLRHNLVKLTHKSLDMLDNYEQNEAAFNHIAGYAHKASEYALLLTMIDEIKSLGWG